MSRTLKRILGCLGVLVLLCAVLGYASRVLRRKDAEVKFHDLFARPEQFDVLLFGSSHMEDGVAPLELWQDYGITAYDCATSGSTMPLTYWTLLSTLEYTEPKLVVIDCYSSAMGDKVPKGSLAHDALDAFPSGPVKAQAVLDLYGNIAPDQIGQNLLRLPYAQLAEYLWDFSLYHARWNELTRQDFYTLPSPQNGALLHSAIFPREDTSPLPRSEKWQGDSVGLDYLRKIIAECQSRGIQVLLTCLPYVAQEDEWRQANTVYDIAEEFGVNYLNMLDMGIVDSSIDYADPATHLNASGARKATKVLGEYIHTHYTLADHRGDADHANWDGDYREYEWHKASLLKETPGLDLYLMLLADDHLDELFVVDDPQVFTDTGLAPLWANLGLDMVHLPVGTPLLITRSVGGSVAVQPLAAGDSAHYDTALGGVDIRNTAVLLDGQECMAALDENIDVGVRTAVFARSDHTELDTAKFARVTRTAIR